MDGLKISEDVLSLKDPKEMTVWLNLLARVSLHSTNALMWPLQDVSVLLRKWGTQINEVLAIKFQFE